MPETFFLFFGIQLTIILLCSFLFWKGGNTEKKKNVSSDVKKFSKTKKKDLLLLTGMLVP